MDHSSGKEELGLFSYMVLGLVGREGAGAHDLRRMARQGRVFDWVGESQYYVEPKRLARLGSSRPAASRARPRADGLRAHRQGARGPACVGSDPSRFPSLKHEAAHPRARRRPGRRRADRGERRRAARRHRRPARAARHRRGDGGQPPHRRRYLQLGYTLVRRLLDVHLEWVDEVERDLGAKEA